MLTSLKYHLGKDDLLSCSLAFFPVLRTVVDCTTIIVHLQPHKSWISSLSRVQSPVYVVLIVPTALGHSLYPIS